jgi:carboxyl-terminal processing protease
MIKLTPAAAALLCLACVQSVNAPSRLPSMEEGSASSPSPPAAPAPDDAAPEPPDPPLVVRPGGYRMGDLPVFSKVLFYVRENYYDKSRLLPRRMLLGALDFVQRDVPEIVIEPAPIDNPQRVVVTVSGESRTFRIDRVDQPWSLRSTMQHIMRFAQAHLQAVPEGDEGSRLLDIETAATNGMLYTLDPHSVLLDTATYAGMRTSDGPPTAGVGLVTALDAQRRTCVSGVLPGSPAERAGVQVRDRIIQIDDAPTAGLTLEDAIARLRGPVGSGVDLHVERDGARGAQKIHLERASVFARSMDVGPRILTAPTGPGASSAEIGVKIGYFHLEHLAADAGGAVADALRAFARQQVGGIVIDLRGNPGGLYEQAARVADAFVKRGTLVSLVAVRLGQRKDELARDDGTEPDVPLAVLVDHDTASGAEIVAATLRDSERAVVLGQQTFGEGSVQVLFDVPSPLVRAADKGSRGKLGLKLTTAQFVTTGDVPIQLRGVAPDIELRDVTVARAGQRSLFQIDPWPSKRSESAYERALTPAVVLLPPGRAAMTLDHLAAPPTSDPSEGEAALPPWPLHSGDDFETSFAAELLARVRQPGRAGALAAAKVFVAETAAREDARIVAAAAAQKVDWRAGARTSGPRLAIKIEPTSGGVVRAGTQARLRGTATNTGDAAAFRVRALLTSPDPVFDGLEMPFGLVAPGEAKTFELAVPIPAEAYTRTDVVRAGLRDGAGDVRAAAAEATVDLEARPAPALSFTCRAIEAAPRAKGGGPASLTLAMQIRNQGTAGAERAEATVRRAGNPPHDGDGVAIKVSRWVGVVAPGAKKDVSFVVDLPGEPRGGPVELDIVLGDPASPAPIRARVRITPPAPGDAAAPRAPWQVTPAAVTAHPPLVTVAAPAVASGETVRVTGEVSADTAARDVFIRVWNRALKMPVRKVFYRNAPANTARLPFDASVPIWPGSNIITVHARDASGTDAVRTVVVLKKDGDRATAAR